MTSLPIQVTKGLFVAGTGTGVGKTTFTRGLLRALARREYQPFPYKPVETGFADPLRSDAYALSEAAGHPHTVATACPFQFALPAAPVVAARLEGIELSARALTNALPKNLSGPLIVESAGGLLSPLSPRETNVNIAELLVFPIVLVGHNSLGTINHCALAIAELKRRRLPLAALILVNVQPEGVDGPFNAQCIGDLCGVLPSLILPYDPTASDDLLADRVEASDDLRGLMHRLNPALWP